MESNVFAVIALGGTLALASPPAAFAEPVEAIAKQEYQLKNPWLAGTLPLLGPLLWVATPEMSPWKALWPFVSATGPWYSGDFRKGAAYAATGSFVTLAYLGSLVHRGCGIGTATCTSIDASPAVFAAGIGLTGLMCWDSFETAQRNNKLVASGGSGALVLRSGTPELVAAALSTLAAPAMVLDPVSPSALFAPLGCGLGHAIAGDFSRAGWVSLGGLGVGVGGALIGRHFDAVAPTSKAGQYSFQGALWSLTAYSLWAGWDAYHTAKKSPITYVMPEPSTPPGFTRPAD